MQLVILVASLECCSMNSSPITHRSVTASVAYQANVGFAGIPCKRYSPFQTVQGHLDQACTESCISISDLDPVRP